MIPKLWDSSGPMAGFFMSHQTPSEIGFVIKTSLRLAICKTL